MIPFVKWVGGKTRVLPEILEIIPSFNTYYEPFVGGGALFLKLAPDKAFINDINKDLMNAFRSVKSNPNVLMEYLILLEKAHNEEFYKWVRKHAKLQDVVDSTSTDELKNNKTKRVSKYWKAACFIYLNKACFNGIYRVNSNGDFNVPSAKKKIVKAFNRTNINEVSQYLRSAEIKFSNQNFEKTVKTATKGDFVYFDPPYDSDTKIFDSYNKKSFGKDGQLKLAEVCKELDKKGVKFLLSNHNTVLVNDLYSDFNIKIIKVRRLIAAKSTSRKFVEEVLITNYEI